MIPNGKSSVVEVAMRELGSRIARIRLSRNLTQANLAREAGASVSSIKRLEAGENTSIDTFVRVLTALNLEDHLSGFLPNPDVRPVERVKREGQERKRARGPKAVVRATEWAWGKEDDE